MHICFFASSCCVGPGQVFLLNAQFVRNRVRELKIHQLIAEACFYPEL